jgi:hypothetical protein
MAADRRSLEKKPVARRRSQEKTGLSICLYLPLMWGSIPEAKIGGLAVPVAAASHIVFSKGADRIHLKSGVGITEMNQKVEPRTGYQIILQSWATGKKIFTWKE